jgi:outer membrane protein assembly factor BamD
MRAILCLCLLVTAACGGGNGQTRRSLTYGEDAQASYEHALEDLRAGRCLEAEPEFQRIRREFPFSRFAALAELRVADCKLDQGEYAEAASRYRQFTKNRPSHSQVPYARFREAESYFRQIPDEWFLSPPAHERDQGSTRTALTKLRGYVVSHPEDERVPEARRMIQQALDLLARHEMYVARFYARRGAHRAVVFRLTTLLHAYEGSGLEAEALLMLGKAYVELEEPAEARETFEELVRRFPDSEEGREAQRRLARL